jgi:probable phosphoglycerate mutase
MESRQSTMKHILFLIRHGQTTWNVEHRLPGQLPGIELTAAGREQAQRLAEALKSLPLTAIISSPLERASETARYLAEGQSLTIQLEPDLMDIELGHWVGQDRDELSRSDPEWKAFLRNPLVGPEDVETFPELQQRAVAAVDRWLKKEATGLYPAFVTHSDVIKVLLAHYTDMEVGRARSLIIENASVSVVELEADHRARILAIGWRPQPDWLHPSSLASEQPKSEEQVVGEQYG